MPGCPRPPEHVNEFGFARKVEFDLPATLPTLPAPPAPISRSIPTWQPSARAPRPRTPRLHGPLGGSAALLDGVRANDAVEDPENYMFPNEAAQGKKSLMQPQQIAKDLLPAKLYKQIHDMALGCKAECGDPWTPDVIAAARKAGPHVTAADEDSIDLVWEEVTYQKNAGFIRILTESELFGSGPHHPELKISRVAVIPQANRRGRIILNLSAEVNVEDATPTERQRRNKGHRTSKHKMTKHPSVNETTVPADDQAGVEALGTAMSSIMQFMFDTDPEHEIDWNKIDLSDGFWRMIVEDGKEWNFAYQLPRRPTDTEDHYVIPSSLQMGWKNSPALFCTATEGARTLIQRILALTMKVGIVTPHRHEKYLFEFEKNPTGEYEEDVADQSEDDSELPWATPYGVTLLSRVFVDDFMNGIAGPPNRARKRQEQLWFGRATLHGIHGIFPPPDVLNHEGGRDSVSEKKCLKGDAIWKQYEILLGFGVRGAQGPGRTIGLPEDKKDKYVGFIRDALDKPRNYMLFGDFQKLHGKLQHASMIMPAMRGHMTPLNRVLSTKPERVGLKQGSELRETLEAFVPLLEASHTHPSHISELVGPDLPDYHGYVDAAASGVGGVWLPCTCWVNPVVWRFQWPADICTEVRKKDGTINNNDVEAAATFIANVMLEEDMLRGQTAGVTSHLGSDNSSTVSWETRGASRATHRAPDRLQRWKALLQRWTRRGPADVDHVAGETNEMADIPSRSFDANGNPCPTFRDDQDDEFLAWFSNRFPLNCYPQNVSWQLRRPSTELTSAVCSLLRGHHDTTIHPKTSTGKAGVRLPISLANTLSSLDSRATATTWNVQTCSWPLLLPSGVENTVEVTRRLRLRQSRRRFAGSEGAWSPMDLETLAAQIQPSTTST